MSETINATAEAAPVTADSLNFADALDAGIRDIDAPKQEAQVPVETLKQSEPKIQETTKTEPILKTQPEVKSDLDLIADRFLKKEEPAQISDDIDIKQPENLKPEAQTAWARLTKDLRDARAKLKELETKSSEATPNSTEQLDLKSQLESLKAERDEYENELRFSRLEATKEYKTAVTEPLTAIQKDVMDIAKLYEMDPTKIYAAMVEPDAAKRRALLKEATANFDPVDSLAVRQKAEDLQKVFERRDILTKDVNTVLQMIENEEKQELEAYQKRSQEELLNAYKTEWEAIQQENPLLRPIKDNESWNNALKAIESKAFEIENTELDPRSKARLTFNAAAMPVVMHVFQDYVSKAQTRIKELETLTKELRAATPSAGSDSSKANDVPSDLGFLEALERGMGKI